MFTELVFQMPSACVLVVCLERLECFVCSSEMVLVTTRTAEVANAVRPQGLCGCFRIAVTNPEQNIDQDLSVGLLNELQNLQGNPRPRYRDKSN